VFDAQYRFPGPVNIIGFHIHSGQANQNGPIVISSGVTSISDATGVGKIVKVLSLPTTDAMLSTIQGIVSNPGDFYVNIHTPEHPAGVMRGQLTDARQALNLPYSVDNATYRSNLGVQNLTDMPGMVLAQLSTKSGVTYEKTIYLPSRGFVQIFNVNPAMGSNEDMGSIRLAPDQPVEAFVSVIQNSNNAPTLVPLAFDGRRLCIGSATNAGNFRSTLVVANEGNQQALVDLTARDINGSTVGQKTGIQIDPMGFFSDTDILTTLGLSVAWGPLEIRSTNGQPISAVSIVYNPANNLGFSLAGREF
ncbi:MAG TPA: CHRD domain-containing protein, partial [Terriglobia bacterium]|nr:CHRD domain-containing protein [Terriglobia bacterium]